MESRKDSLKWVSDRKISISNRCLCRDVKAFVLVVPEVSLDYLIVQIEANLRLHIDEVLIKNHRA